MFGIGYQELLIVLLIVLLVFGGRRIPELARSLGRAFHEFRRARDDFDAALREDEKADGDKQNDDGGPSSGNGKSPPAS